MWANAENGRIRLALNPFSANQAFSEESAPARQSSGCFLSAQLVG